MPDWKPASYPSLSPYLICADPDALIAFLATVFGASVERRFDRPDGSLMHAELRIDDSIVMLGGGATEYRSGEVHLHLYVPDAQAVYQRDLPIFRDAYVKHKSDFDTLSALDQFT